MCTFKTTQIDKNSLQRTVLNHMYQTIIATVKDMSEKIKLLLIVKFGIIIRYMKII